MKRARGGGAVELAAFSSVDRSALRWLRTAESPPEFRLLSGDTTIATLSWAARGGSRAKGTTKEAIWTFKRSGFLAPSIQVRLEGHDAPVARLLAHFRHHEIRIGAGPSFRLGHVSHLLPAWRLTTDAGEEVLHLEPVAERGALQGGAVVVSSQRDAPETLLLVVLSWYFIVLVWFEDEVVEAFTALEGWEGPRGSKSPGPGPAGADAP
jgi:hypothetical protein